jgi:type IV secretory pathway VirB10-like protein
MSPARPFRRLPIAIGLALLAVASAASAQWVWRDANGRIAASDRPPPREIAEKDILQRPNPNEQRRPAPAAAAPAGAASGSAAGPPAARAGQAPQTPLEREVEARKQAEKAAAEAKAKADEERNAAARAENCRRARNNLATLQSGTRLVRTNDRGEQEVVDDAGRNAESARAREVIASDCR